ncbi:hypothetical protein F441_20112 [Phytophthora nicotianae CJ01A1]|uniref:Uncharacterized protein n=1 Tax=Phytophthora nicotianae CJ01A1 TaxID=1317063 RepID=W2VZS2_PHYNI|nr:hypothetical protein F441_20112 [Phytophthora nicotianae CJ01A1]
MEAAESMSTSQASSQGNTTNQARIERLETLRRMPLNDLKQVRLLSVLAARFRCPVVLVSPDPDQRTVSAWLHTYCPKDTVTSSYTRTHGSKYALRELRRAVASYR